MLTSALQPNSTGLQLGLQPSDSDQKLLYLQVVSAESGYQYIIYDLQVDLQPAEKLVPV